MRAAELYANGEQERETHLISLACFDIDRLYSELPLLQMNLMRRRVCRARYSIAEHTAQRIEIGHSGQWCLQYLLLDDRRLMAQSFSCLIDQGCHCFAGKAANEFPHLLQLIHCIHMHRSLLCAMASLHAICNLPINNTVHSGNTDF